MSFSREFRRLVRRHGPFLLVFCGFYAVCVVRLLRMSSWNITHDEFFIFDHARHLLKTGHFLPGWSIDSVVLVGLPRGVLFALMTAGSMALFGVGETAARVPALVAGAMSATAVYWFLLRTTEKRVVALLGVVALMFTPLFVRWHFACRFYSLILFFHVLSTLFLYEGLEGGARAVSAGAHEQESGAGGIVGRLGREGVQPGYLFLFALVFVLNLNQHLALLLFVPAVSVYGMVMLGGDLWRLAVGGAGGEESEVRVHLKYLVLSSILPLCIVVIALSLTWPEGALVRSVPLLEKIPFMLRENFDIGLGRRHFHLLHVLFPWPMSPVLVGICAVGALSSGWFAPGPYRKVGPFLGVTFLFVLVTGVLGWIDYMPRYGVYMLAMYVPLLALGVCVLGAGMVWLWRRSGIPGAPEKGVRARYACALFLMIVLQTLLLTSGRLIHLGFVNPFGRVDYETGYGILYRNLRGGDYVLMCFFRRWYADHMMRRNGVESGDYELETFHGEKKLSRRQLLEAVGSHRRGWVVWARQKSWLLSDAAIEFCREHLEAHHTADGTVCVYSWSPALFPPDAGGGSQPGGSNDREGGER